jgi:hypothetical protein
MAGDKPVSASLTSAPVRKTIQGIDYVRAQTAEGGDLFLTCFGLPFAAHLDPVNWLDSDWFTAHSRRLRGTSAIYQVHTKPVGGRSLVVVVRFNRVAQDLPVDTVTRDCYTHAAFNSPFEEIAEIMALRAARFGPRRRFMPTKRPLAIYSPPTQLGLWQSGRCETQMAVKQARLPEVQLDIMRPYILVYGWIRGIDVQDVADLSPPRDISRAALLASTMAEVEEDLSQAGFRVIDMKPAHIIVRLDSHRNLRRRRDGSLLYALIDYELLERT